MCDKPLTWLETRGDGAFLGVHFRTGEADWVEMIVTDHADEQFENRTCHPGAETVRRALTEAARRNGLDLAAATRSPAKPMVYVAGVKSGEGKQLPSELSAAGLRVVTKEDLLPPSALEGLHFDQLGLVDQQVLKRSAVFVGNGCSTFSMLLVEWRARNGFDRLQSTYVNEGAIRDPLQSSKHFLSVPTIHHLV